MLNNENSVVYTVGLSILKSCEVNSCFSSKVASQHVVCIWLYMFINSDVPTICPSGCMEETFIVESKLLNLYSGIALWRAQLHSSGLAKVQLTAAATDWLWAITQQNLSSRVRSCLPQSYVATYCRWQVATYTGRGSNRAAEDRTGQGQPSAWAARKINFKTLHTLCLKDLESKWAALGIKAYLH